MKIELRSLHYCVHINGSKKRSAPLLLLHGFTGSHKTWDPLISALSENYQTIAVDLIGHGQTDAPNDPKRYAIEEAADDLIELLNQLNIEKAHMLGYSMGGRLALTAACRHPYRFQSLILESSSPGLKTKQEREQRIAADEKLADFIEKNGIEAFIDYWEDIPLFQTQKRVKSEDRASLRKIRLQNRAVGLANSLRGMGTGKQPSLWTQLSALPMPVLLIAGELDKKFAAIAEEMSARIKRHKLAIVSDAGHTIHFENREAFIEIILDFLNQFKEA